MIDLLGHEYGYTPDYVLHTLTRAQVYALAAAISERYEAQAEAIKNPPKKDMWDHIGLPEPADFDENSSPFPYDADASILRMMGVEVVESPKD